MYIRTVYTSLFRRIGSSPPATPRAKPLEVLQFLMDQHGLLKKDLADIFGTPSIVSEVLSGKRELNKDHIKRLSRRFHVSPELFF